MKRTHPISLALAAITLLTGACTSYDRRLADQSTRYLGATGTGIVSVAAPPMDNVSYWDGEGVSGSPHIVIAINHQRAYFYKGDQLVGVSLVSTGREGYGTPLGKYKILQKTKDHISSIYGNYVDTTGKVVVKDVDTRKDKRPTGTRYEGSPMPYFMRFTGGVGMHTGFLPGYAASHGCIRMPDHMARAFFNNVSVGTPVTVVD